MFVNSPVTFSSAQANCRAMSSFVVDIQSAEENNFVRSLITASEAWIGYNDIDFEGTFLWSRTREPGTFTNWSSGEPSNFGGNEDCTTFKVSENEWNDLNCGHTHRYVCEIGRTIKIELCICIQNLYCSFRTRQHVTTQESGGVWFFMAATPKHHEFLLKGTSHHMEC